MIDPMDSKAIEEALRGWLPEVEVAAATGHDWTRDLEVRVTTVEAGLSLVKEIIVAALQDSKLFAAATLGGKAVKDYLEG